MRVALVTDWYHPRVGGIEAHVHGLARALAGRGIDVRVLTPWPGEETVDGIPVRRLDVPVAPGLGVSLTPVRLGRALGRALRKEDPEVVHGHMSIGSVASVAAGWAADRLGLPVLGTFHSTLGPFHWFYRAAAPVLGWRRWQFQVAAVSGVVADDLQSLMPDRTVHPLPNALDTTVWSGTAPEPEPGRLRLVATSRLHRRKRIEALLGAVAGARRRLDGAVSLSLEIVGDGPERARLERRIHALGLSGAVTLLGPGDGQAVRAMLGRGDLFVNACPVEAFGLAGLEAQAMGLPVMGRAEGGMDAFVRPGENGLLVRSDGEMEDALVRLAREPDRLDELREGAAGGIPPELTWAYQVDRHLALYGAMSPSASPSA